MFPLWLNLIRSLLLAVALLLSGCFAAELPLAAGASPPEPPRVLEHDLSSDPASPAAVEVPALHPLSIEALRARSYPGSDLVFEQTLDPGSNYDRYIVSYQSDGLKIYALLTVPRGEKPPGGFPVVLFNHGYIPPAQYRTTERYVAYVDAFARNGYIVIKPDYRGHGSSEGEPASAYGSPDYVIDVLNALASVRRYALADPDRVGMWGHSMGGYITLRAMVADQNLKAGVIWAGVVASYADLFETWFGRRGTSWPSGWRDALVAEYGTPQDNPDFWAALSANSYLAQLSGPVQLHHGTGDTTVPHSFSSTLETQIQAAGVPVELFLYTGDDHNIASSRDDALARSVAFFDRYLKDGQ